MLYMRASQSISDRATRDCTRRCATYRYMYCTHIHVQNLAFFAGLLHARELPHGEGRDFAPSVPLKKVEAACNVLVPCNDDKYSAFAAAVNYRPPSFTSEAEDLLADMRAAHLAAMARRRRPTQAEYDMGYGSSDSGRERDSASDGRRSTNLKPR